MAKRKKKKESQINKKQRKTSLRSYPLMLERRYQRELSKMIKELHAILKEHLFPQLKMIGNAAKNEDPRFDDSADDLSRVLGDIKTRFQDKYPSRYLESLAERRGLEVSEHNLRLLQSQVKQVKGVDLFIAERGVQTKVKHFVSQNVNLIETIHQSYFKDVQTIVYNGVGKGESVSSMAQKITKRTGVSQNRAKLIARDQTSKLNSDIATARQTELGVKKFVWSTAGDERVRDSHADLDGRVFTYSQGADVDGESNVLPGQPINCRCVALPVFDV